MGESFAELFQQSLENTKMRAGDIVSGTVVSVDEKFILINVGLKSEGVVPIEQFKNPDGTLDVALGDTVDVIIESIADESGETRLSYEKAKRAAAWLKLVEIFNNNETVSGYISGRIKGGFAVDLQSVKAFLPGSLIDVRPVSDTDYLIGTTCDFKIIKVDELRNNIVVSRRAVIEQESSAERVKLLDTLEEGQIVKGVVKNLTDYGAFVDIGGIDGLLHITDIAWRRVKHPSDALKVGQEVEVAVLKFDREKSRLSLGMKQLNADPWMDIKKRYPEGTKLAGKVTNITDYGCFVEIENGVEGLVHMSEMDWTNKNIHPSKIVQLGQEVEVVVLEIDSDRRRISLGMKQVQENPWKSFEQNHKVGDKIRGTIRSITDFGIFIGLSGSIDGLVHLSDISWDQPGEEAIRSFKKGDEVEAVVLAIDPERERISLGIKQLITNPYNDYVEANPKGASVKGKVIEVDAKQAILELAENVYGRLRDSDFIDNESVDLSTKLNVGDELETRIVGFNNKDRLIYLSARTGTDSAAKSKKPNKIERPNKQNSLKTTFGDIFKHKIVSATNQESTGEDSKF